MRGCCTYFMQQYMGQVTELWLSCYLVLLSIDSKTRLQDRHSSVTWPIYPIIVYIVMLCLICFRLYIVVLCGFMSCSLYLYPSGMLHHHCSGASEVTLKNKGKIGHYLSTTKPIKWQQCVYILQCTVWARVMTLRDVGKIGHYLGPLLLTWFNFNPSMDK